MNDDQHLEQFVIVFVRPFYCRQTLNHFEVVELLVTVNKNDKINNSDKILEKGCILKVFA